MRAGETPDLPGGIADARLLQLRGYVRTSLHALPAAIVRQVLREMTERRNARCQAPVAGTRSAPRAQMSPAEALREIIWRLDVLPRDDAEAIAALVRRSLEAPQ